MAYPNLPGVIVNTIDGGLEAATTPTSQSTLIIGTAAQGVANQPYNVTSTSSAAAEFGFAGDLVKAMAEASLYSDNVILFRMGTSPMTLSKVGSSITSLNVTNATVASGVVTFTTASNTYAIGDTVVVTITGAQSALSGQYVLTGATSTTITAAVTASDLASTAVTGTVYKVDAAALGFSLEFSEIQSSATTDYKIWYKAGTLAIWLNNELVWSNSNTLGVTDSGDITISQTGISSFTGLQLGTGTVPSLANAVTVLAASQLTGTSSTPAPTLVAPVTGVGMTGRQTYIAALKALDILQGYQCDQVLIPAATLDAPNVAFYVASNSATAVNNPTTNVDALDWLKVTSDIYGNKTYQWASESTDSNGKTATPMSGSISTGSDRVAAGWHEVNWGYLLANFAAGVSQLNKVCMAFIGTSGLKTTKLVDVRTWLGAQPTYNLVNGLPVTSGAGLLGSPYTAGCTATIMNPLCLDYAQGYRTPGFFQNSANQYDGGADTDANQNPIDVGAYLHIFADQGVISTSYATNYRTNLAAFIAGFCSTLDPKNAMTGKPVKTLQLAGLVYNPGQLDALTGAKINVLRSRGTGNNPVVLHDRTAATDNSDYTNITRQKIKGKVIATLLSRANAYIGYASNDGLQLQSMKTALDNDLSNLQSRGYISNPSVQIKATNAEQRVGKARIYVTFAPALELVQLDAYISFTQYNSTTTA